MVRDMLETIPEIRSMARVFSTIPMGPFTTDSGQMIKGMDMV